MPTDPQDPAELQACIDAARGGDEQAIEQLVRRYEPRLVRYVQRNLGSVARRWVDPEDLIQRALFETMRGLDGMPADGGEDELLKRLFRTARSRIYDVARKHQSQLGESVVPEAARERGSRDSKSGTVTRKDTQRWIEGVVDELPPELGEIVRLCAFEELSFVDAGERLGLKPDTVRKRYERARELLAQKLAGKDIV